MKSRVVPQSFFKPGGLHPANRDDLLNNDRYKIMFEHSCDMAPPDNGGHFTYVAKDMLTSTLVCLRIFDTIVSSNPPNLFHELDIFKLFPAPDARPFLLIPLDSFWLEGPNCKHLVHIHELFGQDFFYLTEHGGPSDGVFPPSMIKKIARDAFEAVDFLHGQGIVHGSLDNCALVLTYPDLDPHDEVKVAEFFGQPANEQGWMTEVDVPQMSKPKKLHDLGAYTLNDTGTGKAGTPLNLRFRVKLQGFNKAFRVTDPPKDTQAFFINMCPPTELVFNQPIGYPLDNWYLGLTLALISAPDHFKRPLHRMDPPIENLLALREVLGEFPAHYITRFELPRLRAKDEDKGDDYNENVDEEGNEGHDDSDEGLREILVPEYIKSDNIFAEKDLQAWMKILKGLLRWEPKERLKTAQAVKHDFFIGV